METNPTRVCELLVGLGDVEVLGVDDDMGAPLGVHIRCRAPRPACGGCGGPLWSDGERLVVLADLPAFGRQVELVWHKRRWRCPDSECSAGTVTEQDREIAPPREKLTTRAARWATRQAGRARPVGDVAGELGCRTGDSGDPRTASDSPRRRKRAASASTRSTRAALLHARVASALRRGMLESYRNLKGLPCAIADRAPDGCG